MRDKRQTAAEIQALFTQLIDLLNAALIPRHHSGELDAAETLYIASKALCQVTAVIMFQNEKAAAAGSEAWVDRLLDLYCDNLRNAAKRVIANQREKNEHDEPTQSAWDSL